MRWEDERYVKVYTRDSIDWHFLSFEAQGLLTLILRKVDRAGIMPLGRHGKKGVAAAVGHPTRVDTVVAALDELLADGCVLIRGEKLVVKNFIEAQETKASDAQRKRDQREKERDFIAAQIEDVTCGHAESHAVTPRQDDPSLTKPILEKPSSASPPDLSPAEEAVLAYAEQRPPGPEVLELLPQEPKAPTDEDRVMRHYLEAMLDINIRALDTPKRRKLIRARLNDGHKPQQLMDAIDGLTWSDFHREKGFTDLKYAIGDAGKIEGNVKRLETAARPKRDPLTGVALGA